MKKWYVICGILAVLWLISLGTCSSNSAEVDRAKGELADARAELRQSEANLAELEDNYQKSLNEYSMLQEMKVMTFNNDLQVFAVDWDYHNIKGKVKNISEKPIPHAIILIVLYHEDGSLHSVNEVGLTDLFPGETLEWATYRPWVDGQAEIFDVYAIGSRGA